VQKTSQRKEVPIALQLFELKLQMQRRATCAVAEVVRGEVVGVDGEDFLRAACRLFGAHEQQIVSHVQRQHQVSQEHRQLAGIRLGFWVEDVAVFSLPVAAPNKQAVSVNISPQETSNSLQIVPDLQSRTLWDVVQHDALPDLLRAARQPLRSHLKALHATTACNI
jgi:hypothetical protein